MDTASLMLLVVAFVSVGLWVLRKAFASPASGHSRLGGVSATPSKTRLTSKSNKPSPKDVLAEHGITIEVSISPADSFTKKEEAINTGPITQTADGGWLLNPRSTFAFTMYGISRDEASELKALLDESCSRAWHDVLPKITAIISQTNVRCKEIEAFVESSKKEYFATIENLRSLSSEWSTASEKDREDLLAEFRQQAIQALQVRPNADLETLFEGKPKDVTIDDRLVERYGYDAVVFYLRQAAQAEKVRSIAADHYDRAAWDKLAGLGLARRGSEIPNEGILASMTLKEMSNLVQDLNPPTFRRKAKAVEYLMALPDIENRMREKVSLRQMFQVRELPEEFSDLSLEEVKGSLAYAGEIAELLQHTYVMGYLAFQHRERHLTVEQAITGWQVLAASAESACPHCVEQSQRIFPAKSPPVAPFHVGCRCQVWPQMKSHD